MELLMAKLKKDLALTGYSGVHFLISNRSELEMINVLLDQVPEAKAHFYEKNRNLYVEITKELE